MHTPEESAVSTTLLKYAPLLALGMSCVASFIAATACLFGPIGVAVMGAFYWWVNSLDIPPDWTKLVALLFPTLLFGGTFLLSLLSLVAWLVMTVVTGYLFLATQRYLGDRQALERALVERDAAQQALRTFNEHQLLTGGALSYTNQTDGDRAVAALLRRPHLARENPK